MTSKTVSSSDSTTATFQGYQTCIGDMLIHSEKKILVLPVFLHLSTENVSSSTSITTDQPIIHRLPANHSPVNHLSIKSRRDLKNNLTTNSSNERTTKAFTTKHVLRVHKAGWALIKELKTKVLTRKLSDENFYVVARDDSSERTHF